MSSLARQSLNVEYFGKPYVPSSLSDLGLFVHSSMDSAHAGNAPWEGKNALDAAVLAYTNVGLLRQQLRPDHRVHGIIKGNNWAVNGKSFMAFIHHLGANMRNPVIPEYAKMEYARVACLVLRSQE
jgi:metal-dependent amidase/aminoacylase/carboxypeptidase family protein